MFWTSAVIGLVVLVATMMLVPDVRPVARGEAVDYRGAPLLAAGLTSALIPISQGARWGWSSSATIGLFAAAVALLVAFGMLELRRRHPIVDLRLAVAAFIAALALPRTME